MSSSTVSSSPTTTYWLECARCGTPTGHRFYKNADRSQPDREVCSATLHERIDTGNWFKCTNCGNVRLYGNERGS